MPVIPTYDTPQQFWKLDVPTGGAEVLAQAAHRVGIAGQEAENARARGNRELTAGINDVTAGFKTMEARQTQEEVTKAPLLIAQDQASRLDDLNKIAMTTDPTQIKGRIDQYVGENMGDAKDAFLSNFTTRASKVQGEALWNRHEANIYNHASAISEQANRDQAHQNLAGAVTQFADTAGAHPSTLDENMGLIDHTIDSQLSSLPQGQREAFSTTFRQEAKEKALAASLKTVAFGSPDGSIPPNPAAAKTMLDSGKYDDIIGSHKDTLNTLVETAARQAGLDKAAGDVAQRQAAEVRSGAATSQYFNAIPQVGGQQALPNFGLRVMHDDNIIPEDKAALIKAQSALASGPAPTTNPLTLDHMLTRLTSGDKPSNAQLLNQVSAGNLGIGEAQFLMGQDPNNPALHQLQATLSEGKATLTSNNGSGVSSPAGVQAYQRFQQFAVNAYKNGEPIDAKSMPDVLARFKPTGEDAVSAIPQQARPRLARGGLAQPPAGKQGIEPTLMEKADKETQAMIAAGERPPGLPPGPPPTVETQQARWDPQTVRALAQRGALR